MDVWLDYLRTLVKRGGPSPAEYDELDSCWAGIMRDVRTGRRSPGDIRAVWPALGEPFFTLETMQGFGIRKPHGYAGDFEIIDRIYTDYRSDKAHLAPWDDYFQTRSAAIAVRNRKAYFLSLLRRVHAWSPGRPIHVLSVGCGPARECVEALDAMNGSIRFDLLDQDARALAYARQVNAPVAERLQFIRRNALRFESTTRYDLVWSAGLFDYLEDDAFRRLARRLFETLAPGGILTIGNFGPNNPTRDYMECGEWFLHHRSEDQLYALAHDSGRTVAWDGVCVDREPEGVNLFLHLGRPR